MFREQIEAVLPLCTHETWLVTQSLVRKADSDPDLFNRNLRLSYCAEYRLPRSLRPASQTRTEVDLC